MTDHPHLGDSFSLWWRTSYWRMVVLPILGISLIPMGGMLLLVGARELIVNAIVWIILHTC